MKYRKQKLASTAETVLENPRTNGDNTKPSVRKNETITRKLNYRWNVDKSKRILIMMLLWHSKMVVEFVQLLMQVQSQLVK